MKKILILLVLVIPLMGMASKGEDPLYYNNEALRGKIKSNELEVKNIFTLLEDRDPTQAEADRVEELMEEILYYNRLLIKNILEKADSI